MKHERFSRANSFLATVLLVLCQPGEAFAQQVEPFIFRAPLNPYRIHQLPDFKIHSRDRTDLVIQRGVFAPGVGGWHTHPGPSFAYVVQGQVKLQKYTEKNGCVETPVYGPGQAYFEVGNEIHRAIVVSEESAVLLVVRFNIPVGGPIAIPAPDPGLSTGGSPGSVLCVRASGLYRVPSVTVGLRACSPARPRHPASMPIGVPSVERLPAALSRRLLAETTWRFGYGCRH